MIVDIQLFHDTNENNNTYYLILNDSKADYIKIPHDVAEAIILQTNIKPI